MGIEFNPKNLNASEIFAKLDQADGKKDGKVNKSIWNSFAEAAGGNKIKNFIEAKNAIAAIERYLSKASDDVKQNICNYLGNVDTLETEGETKTPVESAQQTKTQSPKSEEDKRKNLYSGASKTETFKDYGFTREDLVGDVIANLKTYGYDQNGKFIDKFSATTTEAERKKALKAKGKNGYSYVKAKALIRSIQEKWTNTWKNKKDNKLGGNTNLFLWILSRDVFNKDRDKFQERLWNERIFPNMSAKKECAEELKEYQNALADIKELESKYPNIMNCYTDLQEIVYRGLVM